MLAKRVVYPSIAMSYDGVNTNTIDTNINANGRPSITISNRPVRRSTSPPPSYATSIKQKEEMNNLQSMFLVASELYDPLLLPRQKIRYHHHYYCFYCHCYYHYY